MSDTSLHLHCFYPSSGLHPFYHDSSLTILPTAILATPESILHKQPERFSKICSYHSWLNCFIALRLKFTFPSVAHRVGDLAPAYLFCCFSQYSFPHTVPQPILQMCPSLSNLKALTITAFSFLSPPLYSSSTQCQLFLTHSQACTWSPSSLPRRIDHFF